MKLIKKSIFLLLAIALARFVYLHKDISSIHGNAPFYAGSDQCMTCHEDNHKSWHNSTHPKIFKEYTDEAQIVADFDNKPDFVTFSKKDIEVIIGGKWEQVFAREIAGEFYPFPAKWMVLTQKWIPYKTATWKDTALNEKCNGCHTTGLNVESGEFKEYGVGCEACHGPGSRHIENKKRLTQSECNLCHNSAEQQQKLEQEIDIVRSVKSAICGQCHTRGVEDQINTHQTKVQFSFPVEYLPGQKISNNFQLSSQKNDPQGKNWWGNGVSKNRHQEYADFSQSGHTKSLQNLRTKRNDSCGEVTDECLECHSGDYIQAKKYQEKVAGKKIVVLPGIENAQEGITCIVCHDPHKAGDTSSNASEQCVECHTDNTKTMQQHEIHFPCPVDKVTCADCHMPKIVETGGKFSLRSHAFKIIPPQASIKYGMPNSCQNGACHTNKSTQWAITEYEKFYGQGKETDKRTHNTSAPEEKAVE